MLKTNYFEEDREQEHKDSAWMLATCNISYTGSGSINFTLVGFVSEKLMIADKGRFNETLQYRASGDLFEKYFDADILSKSGVSLESQCEKFAKEQPDATGEVRFK